MLKNFLIVLIVIAILTTSISFVLENKSFFTGKVVAVADSQKNVLPTVVKKVLPPPPPPVKLSNPPEIIKAVYATGYSASSKNYLNYLSSLFKNTEINAVVVDIKGSDGRTGIYDADNLVRFLHSQNIYVIGRIAVFEDPVFSKTHPEFAVYDKENLSILWKDNNGLAWMDQASKDVWDYNIFLAKDAFYNHGFDEINFDYVRFPTDGKTSNMGFPVWDQTIPKAEIIKNFFQYARANLPNEKISIDLFGLTTVSADDMGIGQVIENAFESFDYVCPMVYPSHYANGFIGFANPAEHPYEVIKYSLDGALAKENTLLKSKLRPWLQDFNMGAFYTVDMVKQEIKATQDSLGDKFAGFMLWNPSNIYTQDAVLKPN